MKAKAFVQINMTSFMKHPRKGARRQLMIAEAAIQLLYSSGFDSFSFETLAQKCKVTRGLIYHYFPTLTDLLLFASAYIRFKYQRSVVEEMQKHKDPTGFFNAYVMAALQWVDKEPVESSVWIIYFYQCASNPVLAEHNRSIVDMGNQRVEGILNSGISLGEFAIKKDEIAAAARMIQILITGSLLSRATEKRTQDYWAHEFQLILQQCQRIAGIRVVA